jgi:hypothetical protein
MEINVGDWAGVLAQFGVAGLLLKVLLKRDEDDRKERGTREEADRTERKERLTADIAHTAALTSLTEVLRGVSDKVKGIAK